MKIEVWKCEFEFECPKDWNSLQKTSTEDIRFCDKCEKKVYLCDTEQKARIHSAFFNHCVAIDENLTDSINNPQKDSGRSFILGRLASPELRFSQAELKELAEKRRREWKELLKK